MRGKTKLALIGSAVVLGLAILGLGIGTAVVAASNSTSQQTSTTAVATTSDSLTTDNQTSQYDTFVSKVADKLGLDEDTVATAMKEARQEMMDEALAERLQQAVDDGQITQEEADQILEWMKSRPDALDEIGGFGPGFGPRGEGGEQMMGPNGPRPS
jgi:flagellar basal body-associated protein FliL